MKGSWWKMLGVVLMLYVIVAGFLMPLKPGITNVSPQSIKSGVDVTMTASIYNGQLGELADSEIRAWLIQDTTYILQASNVTIVGEQSVAATFSIPPYLPEDEEVMAFSLVIDAPGMGYALLPDNIFVSRGEANLNQVVTEWLLDDVQPADIFDSKGEVNLNQGVKDWSIGTLGTLNKYDGYAIPFSNLNLETQRNLYFHVSLWFSMFILFLISVIYSIRFLRKREPEYDTIASSLVEVGTLFGILGIITGSIWAKNTWGAYWTTDVKLNMTAVSMMIYAAYLVLRTSIQDHDKKAIIASSYNIFAFFIIIPLIFVIPRLTDSLHPGNGGNPGFGVDDLDHTMRLVFYPAVIAFTLIGLWMSTLMIRFKKLREKTHEI